MRQLSSFAPGRFIAGLTLMALLLLLSVPRTAPAVAGPEATLAFASLTAAQANCFFDSDCAPTADNAFTGFSLEMMEGSGFLQSRLWPRGQADTPGHGLYAYLYRVDLRELVGPGNPGCVTSLAFDFGPVVPLDYNGDGSLEHGFIVTSGGEGSLGPTSVNLAAGRLTFQFPLTLCGDYSPGIDNGESTFFFGLASPFRERAVAAVISHNWGDPLTLSTRAPELRSGPVLLAVPTSARAGEIVRLIGAGYTPGGYAGTIRWNGTGAGTLAIPAGGAFAVPFTIPAGATTGDHTITVCSLNPCATGDFEQLASAPFAVTGPALPQFAHRLFLPAITRPGLTAAEPFSYTVDSSVQPFQPQLPGLDGGTPRPLAAVRDPRGTVSTFVANELVVQTDDSTVLAAVLARTGGQVIYQINPAESGVSGLARIYLVRTDLSKANLESFPADITSLMDPEIKSAGRFTYSSNDGPRLFALAAGEAVAGLTVGINWVSEPVAIPEDSREAPNGGTFGGIVYSPNAFDWPHFAQGTRQDIGVPEAWRLMSRAGRLSNRVGVAVLDGGFFPNADFPSTTYISVVPFITDPRNVNGVDGRAPFHGTDVLQTVMARSDNNFGIVGVAAPVANSIAVFTTYDHGISIAAVLAARAAGARVINMSYSADVPGIFGWTVWPFEYTTVAVRNSGVLLFASAGNSNQNVDGEDCFLGICWEHTWHTPCENKGVICVGGLGWDSPRSHANSNFGHRDVDIFAPYTVYSGQSPASPGGGATVGLINGTSFASPYAAGVAALIWASNPSLTANQVWNIMRDTAHSSPDPWVNRYVNAYQAVLTAIGVGVDAELNWPAGGGAYPKGYPMWLRARVGYVATGSGTPVQIQWRVNGSLVNTVTYSPGSGSHVLYPEAFVRTLAEGTHTASIRVTAGTVVVEKSATFTIQNSPPTATINQPANGAAFCSGETVVFRGSAFDHNQPGGMPDSAFAWRSNVNGSLGAGATRPVSTLSVGAHVITLRVTDDGGLWHEASINLTIRSASHPACLNLPPSAQITSPANNSIFYADDGDETHWYKQVTFTGLVGDAEDPIGALNVEWLSDLQGSLGTPSVNPSTGATTITANIRMFHSCGSRHTITLRVTDTAGNVTEDQIRISISAVC
jgi:serine protease